MRRDQHFHSLSLFSFVQCAKLQKSRTEQWSTHPSFRTEQRSTHPNFSTEWRSTPPNFNATLTAFFGIYSLFFNTLSVNRCEFTLFPKQLEGGNKISLVLTYNIFFAFFAILFPTLPQKTALNHTSPWGCGFGGGTVQKGFKKFVHYLLGAPPHPT